MPNPLDKNWDRLRIKGPGGREGWLGFERGDNPKGQHGLIVPVRACGDMQVLVLPCETSLLSNIFPLSLVTALFIQNIIVNLHYRIVLSV